MKSFGYGLIRKEDMYRLYLHNIRKKLTVDEKK
jgi:hypothetical protein